MPESSLTKPRSGSLKPSAQSVTVGIDLGGTKIEMAVVDASGGILVKERYSTHARQGAPEIIASIARSVGKCLLKSPQAPSAVGIGVAGQVDAATGIVHFAPNLDWHEVALQRELEDKLHLPVLVTNDVRAATWGERLYGAGKNCDDMVCLFVGTGIGGGIVSAGRMLTGATNTAGEIGHMTIVAGGRPCHCPNRGCLEAYAGGWAIAKRARQVVRRNPEAGHQLTTLAGNVESITAITLAQAHRQGDPLARRLIEEAGAYLAAGVVGIVNSCSPRLVVLGGGVIEGFPGLIPMVDQHVQRRGLTAAVKGLKVVAAVLGNKAGVIGAAAMARMYHQGKT